MFCHGDRGGEGTNTRDKQVSVLIVFTKAATAKVFAGVLRC